METAGLDTGPLKGLDKNALMAVLQFLNRNNLQSSEEILRKETGCRDPIAATPTSVAGSAGVGQALTAYSSDDSPQMYTDNYNNLKKFVDKLLDMYKYELGQLLYPVFVHLYLGLVYNEHRQEAGDFLQLYRYDQEAFFQSDVDRLAQVQRPDHMLENDLVQHFRSNQYSVRLCRDSYVLLKRHMQEKCNALLTQLVQDHLLLDVFEGVPRGRQLVRQTAGALEGDPGRQVNKTKMLYGLLKEPDIQLSVPVEEDDDADTDDKPKKKKMKKDSMVSKKSRHDPNAPNSCRIPLPDLRDVDKREKAKRMREAMKRISLGPDSPPSICFYTFLNSADSVSCATLCEDSSLMAAGFDNSTVRVWSLWPQKLRSMKSADELINIDKDADDVLVRMMDDRSAEQSRTLSGHSGPVHAVSFSPDKTLLLSGSEDGTIRLWSLQTWTCLVCYKGHVFPVWDVQFSPHGHYFCSGGHDRTARVWATDHHQPLRVMTGHYADVDCVAYHPNSNYIASGSSDRSVRVWDVSNGACVRILTGHKDSVYVVSFSPDGRFLLSSGSDCYTLCWDMATGFMVAALTTHTDTVYSLQFSRDATVLATGGLDNCIHVWDFVKMTEDVLSEDVNALQAVEVRSCSDQLLLGSYSTKRTPLMALHFTRRNLLLAAGPFDG